MRKLRATLGASPWFCSSSTACTSGGCGGAAAITAATHDGSTGTSTIAAAAPASCFKAWRQRRNCLGFALRLASNTRAATPSVAPRYCGVSTTATVVFWFAVSWPVTTI